MKRSEEFLKRGDETSKLPLSDKSIAVSKYNNNNNSNECGTWNVRFYQ